MAYGAAVLTPPATPEPSQVHLRSSGSQDRIQHPDSPQRHHQHLATKVNAIDHQHHQKIFRQLERINPRDARSLEDGLEETLTVHRLGIGAVLRWKPAITNPIESCLSTVQRVARNVKRWRAGNQPLRWTAQDSWKQKRSSDASKAIKKSCC